MRWLLIVLIRGLFNRCSILHNVLFHINDFVYTISIEERKNVFAAVLQDAHVLAFMLDYCADFLLLPYK